MAGLSLSSEYREMLVLLKRAREASGLTQTQVAHALGKTQPSISKIEGGEIRIDPVMLVRFAQLYAVEVTNLLPKNRTSERKPTHERKGKEDLLAG